MSFYELLLFSFSSLAKSITKLMDSATKIYTKLFVFLLLVTILVSPTIVLAAPNAGITPNSPFYFLDLLFEKIDLVFTFNHEKEVKKLIEYAGERLAEARQTADKNRPKEVIEKALLGYEKNINLASKKVAKIKDNQKARRVLATMLKAVNEDQQELASDFKDLGQDVKNVVEDVIESSGRSREKAIQQVIDFKNKPGPTKLLSPNGGEVYKVGGFIPVQWEAGEPGIWDIELVVQFHEIINSIAGLVP
jgi:hypothetical protein